MSRGGAPLSLTGVRSAYGESTVLFDVSLDQPSGTLLALIGRNGVGKTTLLGTVMGVRPTTAGQVLLDGKDITTLSSHMRARAGVGFVPQGRHIFPQLTVMENLEAGLAANPARGARVPDLVFDLFPKLGEIRSRKGGFLSGGEQQQLAIGRALAGDPRLLLLDEPTEGIQPNVVAQIETALRTLRDSFGMTIIVVEQYLDFVWRIADRYAAMQGGRIIRSGMTADDSAADVAHLVQI